MSSDSGEARCELLYPVTYFILVMSAWVWLDRMRRNKTSDVCTTASIEYIVQMISARRSFYWVLNASIIVSTF